ncbi:tagaturonate reductase [Maribacter chungangensis]|uniref:Tagaturonate reductase n=1 Tax=Maribacter chungangensis TaxID=1069117 RepID=A0ABW3B056_9FLAO
MKKLNRQCIGSPEKPPIKIIQFGEGNFLRAFVGNAIQELNKETGFNAGIAVVQPIPKGMVQQLKDQDGCYTLFCKGIKNGEVIAKKEIIANIVTTVNPYTAFENYLALAKEPELQFIISNTTEAGIAFDAADTANMCPPNSFPAKLTLLLYQRFIYFKGAMDKGPNIIPCELINHNADTLKKYVLKYTALWNLGDAFVTWLHDACSFHNSLVDRIVTGYPKDDLESYTSQLDYVDKLIVSAETFFLWVIEGNAALKSKLPFHKTSLDVNIVEDMQPYRTRKVRILNGAHTAMVPFSILHGNETVKESVDNVFTGSFIRTLVFEEIIPTLSMDKTALKTFANDVFDRFRNPFIKHRLASIALNSVSKFKVRVLPGILEYINLKKELPLRSVFAFACLLLFYKGTWRGKKLPVQDDEKVILELSKIWQSYNFEEVASRILSKTDFWGQDLNGIPGLAQALTTAIQYIEEEGIETGWVNFLNLYKTQNHAS